MSEIVGNTEPKPQDPDLTASQKAIKSLCDDILALKPADSPLTFEGFATKVSPELVQECLRSSSVGDLMLSDGDTLSAVSTSDHYPELGLFIGQAELVGVEVRAWGWEDRKCRIDPNGPKQAPYDLIYYPGEKDWMHELDIILIYSDGKNTAYQTIAASTSSDRAGTLPMMSRDVSAMAYAETGYEGHNQVSRPTKDDDEVLEFVTLARELFDARIDYAG